MYIAINKITDKVGVFKEISALSRHINVSRHTLYSRSPFKKIEIKDFIVYTADTIQEKSGKAGNYRGNIGNFYT